MAPVTFPEPRVRRDTADSPVTAPTGLDRRYTDRRGTVYNRAVHELRPRSPFLMAVVGAARCNNHARDAYRLILYRHRGSRRFVLAYWTVMPGEADGPGLLQTIEPMDRDPDRIYDDWCPPRIDYLMVQLLPAGDHWKEADRKMRDQELEAQRAAEETVAQKLDLIRHLQRRDRDDGMARSLSGGMMPFLGDREALLHGVDGSVGQEALDITRAKHRIISTALPKKE